MTPRSRSRPINLLPPSGEQIALLVTAVVVVTALAWAGMRFADRDDDAGLGSGEPGVAHVHGLGVNPADRSLIVATHYGSFRIPVDGEEAERIGGGFQDTMGFTVAGPDHFLGSGHPDDPGRRAGQPTRLGLIESTDGGVTWANVSLGGEVDFHGLVFAHDLVYGWDSGTGRFMVSGDRTNWEVRSSLDLVGFAVDPTDDDHVVGTGPEGLTESFDGGRSWTTVDGPRVVTVSWDAVAGLWGAEPGGVVWHRIESEWERAGALPGEAQVLLATSDALYAAAHHDDGLTGIYRSSDGGRTWDLRYQDAEQ